MKSELRLGWPDILVIGFLAIYSIVNVLLLTRFPFVHSDEAWLSGLSLAMLDAGNPGVTEPFFDLYPRAPHAVKIFFHLLQLPYFGLFGYSVFAARMLSFTFALLTLMQFYQTLRHITHANGRGRTWIPVLLTAALALDVQFLYASHFARQEIVLLFVLVTLMRIHLTHEGPPGRRQVLLSAGLLAFAMGVHPNSFVIALPFVFHYFLLAARRSVSVRLPLILISLLGLSAAFFAGMSLTMNDGFFSDYRSYGATLGVTATIVEKIAGLVPFLKKLYLGISGTYYLPDIRPQFFIFTIVICIAALAGRRMPTLHSRAVRLNLLVIFSLMLGIILIGRYSQPSIIFVFPSAYLLIALLYDTIPSGRQLAALSFVSLTLIAGGVFINMDALSKTQDSYAEYLESISKTVPSDASVLANLNAGYYFESGALLDYRNLAYLPDHDLSFGDYIDSRGIAYILYPDEMDMIYSSRPRFNSMYGNVARYYDDMVAFFEERCVLVDTIKTPYALRIANRFPDNEANLRIYKVIPSR